MRRQRRSDGLHADRDGVYGCRKCGSYTVLICDDPLGCLNCRTAIPMEFCRPLTDKESKRRKDVCNKK